MAGSNGSSNGADRHVGVGAVPHAGTALLFDVNGQAAEAGSWHAPCAVGGSVEKWIVTFFKSKAEEQTLIK